MATAAYATYYWSSNMDLTEPATFTAVWNDFQDNDITVNISRGALDPIAETVEVSADVTVLREGAIEGLWIEICSDDNSNANIESNEWHVFATGTVDSSSGRTIATIESVDVDVDFDGYRLHIKWDDGDGYEVFVRPGFTYDL